MADPDEPSSDPAEGRGADSAGDGEGDSAEDELIETLSDYLDGTLPAGRRPGVEHKLASDDNWKRVHGELLETRNALSGMRKARAPDAFETKVTSTIHRRSAGRFFARRTFGDRVPFGALLIVAVLGLCAIARSRTARARSRRRAPTRSAISFRPRLSSSGASRRTGAAARGAPRARTRG